jgi:cell division protein FtsW
MANATFSRRDTSVLGRWWWTVDRWSFSAILIIMAIGVLMSFAASPPVADRLGLGTFFFVKRHLMMIPPALIVMVGISLLMPHQIRRFASYLYLACIALLVLTLFYGLEIKGARRWIMLGGMF